MNRILLLLAIFCIFDIGASAQIHQDVIPADTPFGVTLSGTQTLENKTLMAPKISMVTTLPTCDSSNEGKVDYYKPASVPGFMVSCINNGGLYELVPMSQHTVGFMWFTEDFDSDASAEGVRSGDFWHRDPEVEHPGVAWLTSQGTGSSAGYLAYLVHGGDGSAFTVDTGSDNYTVEWIFKPLSSVTSVKYLAGVVDGVNSNPAGGDNAFFRFDTNNADVNWIAVTEDNDTETTTDTGVAVAVGNWYRLVVVYNGTDVKFYAGVNGADVVLVATHDTNLPSGDNIGGYFEVREHTASSRGVALDFYRLSSIGLDR